MGFVSSRRLTPQQLAERDNDPTELTRRFYRHPWRAGVGSGALLATWTLVLGLPWPLAVGVGVVMMIFTGLMWRPGGPAQRLRRYLLRRFPKNV